jgi:histidinol-phosphate aminotransferase
MSLATLARPEILALEAYSLPAADPGATRLNANENPWRYPGDASAAGLNRYPEPYPLALEARLAEFYGVPAESLLCGRGSDEGIDLLTRTFCRPGRDAVVICPPTFGMYRVTAMIQGAAVIEVPLAHAAGYALDPARLLAAVTPAVKLVFLCSPGNPTGAAIPAATIATIAAALAGRALVVVDEAYAEFMAGPGALTLRARHANLVVLRTLSKAYALAGARVGSVIAAAELVALMRRVIPPYAMPTTSSEAALAALAPAPLATARERIAELVRGRERLAGRLAATPGVERVWPSDANFLLTQFTEPARALAAATAAGILVRDFSHGVLTPGCLRITVGTPADNERLIAALQGGAP